MASAGQAHAHSSQPTHFSSPSGCRLSWWRPWKRGAVGFLYSGYCSVSRFLNMALKVTPKPATGAGREGDSDGNPCSADLSAPTPCESVSGALLVSGPLPMSGIVALLAIGVLR